MIRKSLLGGLILTSLATCGQAQDRHVVPEATPPRFVSVIEVKGEVVVYRDFLGLSVTPKAADRQDHKGLIPANPYPGPMIACAVEFSLKDGEVYEAGGGRLDAEAVKRRLVVGATVLVSTSGKKVDPAYLRIVEKGSLILVPPVPPTGPPLPTDER
jgi:hypothetical protein